VADPQKEREHLSDKRRLLLFGGILAPLFYLAGDIAGNIANPEFSFIRNAVSEMIQSGSDAGLPKTLFFISSIMSLCFGVGISMKFPLAESRLLFVGGVMFAVLGTMSALTSTVLPMDPIGAKITLRGFLHLALTGIGALACFPLVFMVGIGLERKLGSRSFKIYSFATFALLLVSGAMTAVVLMNGIQLLGLIERLSVYLYCLWAFILAYKLIRAS
jgi:hypothetical protein